MAEGKIEIKVGEIAFSGSGEEKWVSEQLDKILSKIPELVKVVPTATKTASKTTDATQGEITGTLASFLKEKNAVSNQTRRFLATAAWLHGHENKTRLQTGDVSKVLSSNSQPRLSNPADCLNKNASKGHCQKEGKEFFVTPDGYAELGK